MFILSGALYVLGALVFEMVGGFTTSAAPRNWRAIKGVCITLEESFENAAVVLFITTLLAYIKTHLEVGEISLEVS
jgi:hypothetical protein